MKPLCYSINQIPEIVLTETPYLNKQEKLSLKKAEEAIETSSNMFNGKAIHIKEVGLKKITAFEGTYAWNLASKNLPTLGYLGASLILKNEELKTKKREYLWQKRSSLVELPGYWDFSASGGASIIDIEKELKREALEEIGQKELINLHPEAIYRLPGYKLDILFSATWSKEELVLNEEISNTFWSENPPGDISMSVKTLFSFFRLKNK